MNYQIAYDQSGREWAVLAIDSGLKARLVHGVATPAVMDLDELVEVHGPLIMSPTRPTAAGGSWRSPTLSASSRPIRKQPRSSRSDRLPHSHSRSSCRKVHRPTGRLHANPSIVVYP